MLTGLRLTEKSNVTDAKALMAWADFTLVRVQGLHDGRLMDDQAWAGNRKVAMESGKRWGTVMDVVYGTDGASDPWAQAVTFLNMIDAGGRNWHIPPVLWCEEWPGKKLPANYAGLVWGAVEQVLSRLGRYPILASNVSLLKALGADERLRRCPVMVVFPTSTLEKPIVPVGWDRWALWEKQFQISTWPGAGVVSVVHWPGDHAQLKAWCLDAAAGIPVYTPGEPEPEPEPDPEPEPGDGFTAADRAKLDAIKAVVDKLAWLGR